MRQRIIVGNVLKGMGMLGIALFFFRKPRELFLVDRFSGGTLPWAHRFRQTVSTVPFGSTPHIPDEIKERV